MTALSGGHPGAATAPGPRGGAGQRAVLALGSSLGDRLGHLDSAVRLLERRLSVEVVSSVYRSRPEGGAEGPDYYNAVVVGRWSSTPLALLELAGDVEERCGRTRPFAGAPRTLDVDLIFLGATTWKDPRLTLPHPRWQDRPFVLAPLAEVLPELVAPGATSTVAQLWDRGREHMSDLEIVAGPEEWRNRW